MIFSSLEFVLFFLLFIITFRIFSNYQKSLIIIFSLFFYGYWNPIFLLLILYLILFAYFFIKRETSLKISIPIILIPLFYFKYSYFLIELTNFISFKPYVYNSSLPLAISFITFTIVALLIDIRTKKYKDKISLVSLTEFLIYFPQLIAGPILRAKELLPRLRKKIFFENKNIKFGIILFTVGFVKKIFFADSIAIYIDPIFNNPNIIADKDIIKAYLLFPLQIYFDFSGYVDMALGISKILGVDLPINFNKPYLSSSLTNFWRNWHITLSRWFKDYIYIPLGGSKLSSNRLLLNLVITMSIAGFWHGASLNFILWGFLNGLILFVEKKIGKFFNLNSSLKIFITCFIIFSLWIVFRIDSFSGILDFYKILLFNLNTIFYLENMILFLVVILAIYSQKLDNYKSLKTLSRKFNLVTIFPIFFIIILTGLAINVGSSEKFIYFDF
jgi:alginate O-acetyltransferase complex protein AlgI